MVTKPLRRFLTWFMLVAVLVFASTVLAASTLEEADLTSFGEVYEVNVGLDGRLYISDYNAYEIWMVEQENSNYTVYENIAGAGPLDAQADSANRVWWSDGSNVFGYVNRSNLQMRSWTITDEMELGGITIDPNNYIWMSTKFGSESKLYRFNPTNRELCVYSLPGGVSSYYLIYRDGVIWLANWSTDRIIKFKVSNLQVDRWHIGFDANLNDLDMDENGHLWLTDSKTNALLRLDPSSNTLTSYSLPYGSRPWLLSVSQGQVWYTENSADSVGWLNPGIAQGISVNATHETPVTATASCTTLPEGASSTGSTRTGTLTWTASSGSTVSTPAGWTVYQLPTDDDPNANPWGIASSQGYAWVSQQVRQKLVRLPQTIFLHVPLVYKRY